MWFITLFRDRRIHDGFFSKWWIVADQGFRKPWMPGNVVVPITTVRNVNRWLRLTDGERKFSSKISSIEKRIENMFADTFRQNWGTQRL